MTEIFDQQKAEMYELTQIFENQKIMNVPELAKLLKCSSKTIYRQVSYGKIPHKKIGKHIRFHLPEIEEWLKGG